jgi:hypothetical protein
MQLILTLLALATLSHAGTCVLTWTDQPGCDYRVWQGVRLVKTVKSNQATITLPDSGVSSVYVTAFDPTTLKESLPAEIKLVPLLIEVSNDLGMWRKRTTIYDELGTRLFYRTPKLSISL